MTRTWCLTKSNTALDDRPPHRNQGIPKLDYRPPSSIRITRRRTWVKLPRTTKTGKGVLPRTVYPSGSPPFDTTDARVLRYSLPSPTTSRHDTPPANASPPPPHPRRIQIQLPTSTRTSSDRHLQPKHCCGCAPSLTSLSLNP